MTLVTLVYCHTSVKYKPIWTAKRNLVDAVVEHSYKMSAIDSVFNILNLETEIITETELKMI